MKRILHAAHRLDDKGIVRNALFNTRLVQGLSAGSKALLLLAASMLPAAGRPCLTMPNRDDLIPGAMDDEPDSDWR